MKKIVIVVADGRVESVFSNEDIEVEVEDLGNYVDECRETMKEVRC